VLRLGFEYLASQGITELGRPILERMRDDTGYAASLVVRDGRDIVYILRAASPSPFASSVSVGTRLPAHATVLGHVLLSDLTLSQLRALYPESKLEAINERTPATTEALFEQAQQARQRGHVMAEGFFESHICTVAAPVFGDNGHVVAAIGLTIPGARIAEDRRAALVAQVRGAATQLSTLLNYDAKNEAPAEAPTVALVGRPGKRREKQAAS
jgi:DNA-binding IclR family transcriptional regulator